MNSIYSIIPKELLQLKLTGVPNLQVISPNNNISVEEHLQLFNSAIGGLFEISKSDVDWKILLTGETMKSFNIIFEIKDQCQFRVAAGPKALFCALIPNRLQFQKSTALIVRLENTNTVDIEVCVFGEEFGSIQLDTQLLQRLGIFEHGTRW